MGYISQYEYYANNDNAPNNKNWGSYQYVSLYDIVNNFMLMYAGNHNLVNNEERYKVIFHAKRAIQELNYDAFKEVKALELKVDDRYRFVLPSDFVNWVRVSVYKDGVLMPLSENTKAMTSNAYLQDNTGKILFDESGNILRPEYSNIDMDRINGMDKSVFVNSSHAFDGCEGYNYNGTWYFDAVLGSRFGLNTETANANPTFQVDKKSGVIVFSSNIGTNTVIVEYISDGMENGDDSLISVNKMFEGYLYAAIEYEILNSKLNVQEYIVHRARKRKTALLRNSRIRLGNIHAGRLLMNMRGADKWIK